MNLTELKYIVAIAQYGSVNAAAREVYVAQPNISKAIKNLEEEFGIRLFERSSAGMVPTEEGHRFIQQAKQILEEIERLKADFSKPGENSAELKISIPRATYASYAAVEYIRKLENAARVRIQIRECSAMDSINNILRHDHHLAVVRYDVNEEKDYASLFKLKGLDYEPLLESDYLLLVNKDSPLAGHELSALSELDDYLEIVHGDERLPNGDPIDMIREIESPRARRVVQVYERGSQFDLLRKLLNAYMWVSPMPGEILEQYGLIQKRCACQKKRFRDVIVYPQGRIFRKEERDFIGELKRAAVNALG